jgi:hypothetical protein
MPQRRPAAGEENDVMYPNVIDFETAVNRARDLHAAADRARLALAVARGSRSATSNGWSARRRIGGLVVRLGEWIGGAESAAGSALVTPRSRAGCA